MNNERNLMTTSEASRYLGLKQSYLYKLMMRRAIPYFKPSGKLCFFDKADLDSWLRSVRVKTQSEIDSEAARYILKNKNKQNVADTDAATTEQPGHPYNV